MSDDGRPTLDMAIKPLSGVPEEGVLRLASRSLGAGPTERSVEYWRWKHVDNPFGTSLGLVAVTPDGRLAAMRAFMRWDWQTGDTSVSSVRAVDTATHPDFRRRGLFRRLTLEALEIARNEGVRFVFNTPNRKSLPGYLGMDWKRVSRVPLLLRPLRPLRAALRAAGAARAAVQGEPRPDDSVRRLLETPGLPEMLETLPADPRLRTVPDVVYLAWRFRDVPGIHYRAQWDLDSGSSGAVVLYRERPRRGMSELSISTVLASSDEPRRAAAVLRGVLRDTSADYAVACAARGTPERRALIDAGFLPLPAVGPILVVRQLGDPRSTSPGVWQNWRLQLADLELF